MNIYIDESGSFVSAPARGSWNAVVAVVAAESARTRIQRSIAMARTAAGAPGNREIKLNELDEAEYICFIESLFDRGVVMFATATDAGLNTLEVIEEHQRAQVSGARKYIPKMKFDSGRDAASLLADQLEVLSPQLYVQLICQVNLLHDVTTRAITYFAQRIPGTLREVRWRIDQKNTSRTVYEDTFEKVAPSLLQSRSIEEPMPRVRGFDYSHFQRYEFEDGKMPDYLQRDYGLPPLEAINIQKLIRGNIKFEDSTQSDGIQVADLLASGLRRLLRGGFRNQEAVARALGRLALQNVRNKVPFDLVSLSKSERATDEVATRAMQTIRAANRPMLLKRAPQC